MPMLGRGAVLVALTIALAGPGAARAQAANDGVLLEMQQAYKKNDKPRVTALLEQLRAHPLESLAAYWDLKLRLEQAQPAEIRNFLQRWKDSYYEDRLRNDWLLLLGQRRDWDDFLAEHPSFRMNDDPEVRCYALAVEHLRTGVDHSAEVRRLWLSLRNADEGCTFAADRHYGSGKISSADIWKKARLSVEANRLKAARAAVGIEAPELSEQLADLYGNAARFLKNRIAATGKKRQELAVLALARLAGSDPDAAAAELAARWDKTLNAEERNWAWGVIGKQAATRLSPLALRYFGNVSRASDLSDEHLAWMTRAALRQGDWKMVQTATAAMSDEARADPAWTYWRARALMAPGAAAPTGQARQLLEGIASTKGFYEKLAAEELGRLTAVPERPTPPSAEEKQAARANPGLYRALYAFAIGLRPEAVREWNYHTNLHTPGGMSDRELLAAADWACERQVWDRCVNTSERTRGFMDYGQRFPMPFRDAVVKQAEAIGLEPAYVYGLIRQESRFIMDARSHVGASGLMQVMPATARWTARKIGLTGFTPDQINDRDTNILIGTSYLKLALDDMDGSMPLAAAAYNAGPNRPRVWRNGPLLEGAIWAENVPFAETREYVKKVLSNTTDYAAILSGQPQSLKARLGSIGPRSQGSAPENRELP